MWHATSTTIICRVIDITNVAHKGYLHRVTNVTDIDIDNVSKIGMKKGSLRLTFELEFGMS